MAVYFQVCSISMRPSTTQQLLQRQCDVQSAVRSCALLPPLNCVAEGHAVMLLQMIDALVAAAGPLPDEYANRTQTLLCNDCEVVEMF